MLDLSMDYQVEEVESWIELLSKQRNFFFTNHGLKQFWFMLMQYPDFEESVENLLADKEVGAVVEAGFEKNNYAGSLDPFLRSNSNPIRYYSVCAHVLRHIAELDTSIGNLIYNPTLDSIPSSDPAHDFPVAKNSFIDTYLRPLAYYLIRKHILGDQRVHLFKRYRILCVSFDWPYVSGASELDLTSQHLPRFLFSEGIDHVFSETNVPSGRIDVFSESHEIVVEGKIFNGADLSNSYKPSNR